MSENCDGWGICMSGCLNGVFAFPQEESALQKIKASKSGEIIAFICRRYNAGLYPSWTIKLNYIGSITLPDILYSAMKVKNVIIAI